ncbi:MAG: AsmA family protein [Rhizobiaceae bacterium]
MIRVLAWVAGILVGLLALAFLGAWLLLQSPFFSDYRRNLIQSALSDGIGQPLIIRDDVRMQIRSRSTVFIGGVEIPSENIEGVNLAQLEGASFKLDLLELVRGRFIIDQLEISKLHVNLLTEEDRTTSWTKSDWWEEGTGRTGSESVEQSEETENSAAKPSKDSADSESSEVVDITSLGEKPQTSFFKFLSDKTANFDDLRLTIDNKWTGFQFNFVLNALALEQLERGELVSLASDGEVNERKFAINGRFPRNSQFETSATFGGTKLHIEGTSLPEGQGEGYVADLQLDTGSIADFLEAIGLQREFDGQGKLLAKIDARPGGVKVSNVEMQTDFEKGQSFTVSGEIGNILELAGVKLELAARLHPEDEPISKAQSLKDLQLVDVEALIVSNDNGLELENLHIGTNAFEQELRNIGPVSIARLYRNTQGELSVGGVDVQIGPKGKPVIRAKGDIENLLGFTGVEIEGQLEAGADLLLKSLAPERVAEFGSVRGEFTVSDASGELAITRFSGRSFGSDLWSLESNLSVRDVKKLSDLKFDFDLGVADGARFLKALNLEPVDTGKLRLAADINGESLNFNMAASATIDKSRLDASLRNETREEAQVVRGDLKSEEIHIDDLSDVVRATLQLRSMFSRQGGVNPDVEVQPLVIEEEPKPEPEKPQMPKNVLPLVIDEDSNEEASLLNGENILRRLDLEFGIDIKKIVGQEGVSGLNSELTIKQGKLKFGPLKANYGGGNFNVTGAVDLINSRDFLQVSGSTSGWDVGEILDSIGLGIDAYGRLNGSFNVRGNTKSIASFVNSADGNVTVRMTNGRIATSLVELAGLGIFKWLFSAELRQGYTDIVCINAPVRLSKGNVSSSATVVETNRVQLVVKGRANWRNDTIALRAEPRPVGRPLSRSAFPFEVRGKLSAPEFKLDIGGSPGLASGLAIMAPKTNKKRLPCVPDAKQPGARTQ